MRYFNHVVLYIIFCVHFFFAYFIETRENDHGLLIESEDRFTSKYICRAKHVKHHRKLINRIT